MSTELERQWEDVLTEFWNRTLGMNGSHNPSLLDTVLLIIKQRWTLRCPCVAMDLIRIYPYPSPWP